MLPAVPIYKYSAVSISNVIATTCQYEALKHVSFPVQTIAKCAKMVPVMIWYAYSKQLQQVVLCTVCAHLVNILSLPVILLFLSALA